MATQLPDVPLGDADLPDDPHLDWLRKQAKRVRRDHPGEPLAAAQLRVARHHGFPSWRALRQYVELVRSYRRAPDEVPEQAEAAAEFLRLACLTYGSDDPTRRTRAAALLRDHPNLGSGGDLAVHVAAARADAATLRTLLAADPALAVREGGPFDWAPLAYLAYARHDTHLTESDTHLTESDTLASATLLLDAGADPDTGYLWHGLPSPFTVLTGAFGSGEGGADQPPHPHGQALARLLLERGADANDAQALYNRMFEPDDAHLRLLFEFGLGRGDGGPWKRRLGRAALTPADMLLGQLAWAVLHGYDGRIELLAAHGVDLDAVLADFGGDGRTAYAAAVTAGRPGTADLLVRLGAAAEDLPATDRLVAAVSAGRRPEVERLCAEVPGLLDGALAARPGLVPWLAERGDLAAVRLAVELGWDVDRRARTDVPSDQQWETGLHAAAGNGDVAMARLLLDLGADRRVRDARFDGTPRDRAVYFGHDEVAAVLADPDTAGEPPPQ